MDRTKEDAVEKDMQSEVGCQEVHSDAQAEDMPVKGGFEAKAGLAEDDGRRIADMNMEGMPWYMKEVSEEEMIRRAMEPTLNARETRKMISSALAASLLVAFVFIGGMALFLCFCLYVWF